MHCNGCLAWCLLSHDACGISAEHEAGHCRNTLCALPCCWSHVCRHLALQLLTLQDKQFYPVDFTQIYGPQVGIQSIHMTVSGACDMGTDMANQYIAGLPTLVSQDVLRRA